MHDFSDEALLRYSRHILLPEIDIEGQSCLAKARVLIVGAGGLGSPVALYLASAGVGYITIVDNDDVDLTNLQRQVIHDMSSIGHNKAQSAAKRMQEINPEIKVTALTERLEGDELSRMVGQHDLVLDCSDNFATRHAINRATVQARVPLVSGAAVSFSGQLIVFDASNEQSPCYHCLFPGEQQGQDAACATFGVLSPLVGVIGSLQAVEAVKWIIGLNRVPGQLLLYDAALMSFRSLVVPRDPECKVCAGCR